MSGGTEQGQYCLEFRKVEGERRIVGSSRRIEADDAIFFLPAYMVMSNRKIRTGGHLTSEHLNINIQVNIL